MRAVELRLPHFQATYPALTFQGANQRVELVASHRRRGLRLPPLMFTAAGAMGLIMAALESDPAAADPADLVGGALPKIVWAPPERAAQ